MVRIFVSYRREDSPGHSGRLYDHLVAHFGEEQVFRDIEAIELGEDFVVAIEKAVGACDVLVAVIGPHWLDIKDKQGHRRIDGAQDFVRLEIATALTRNVRVIPVLVNDATLPGPEELPADLVPLTRRNSIEVSDIRFRSDMERLVHSIEGIAQKPEEVRPGPTAAPPSRSVTYAPRVTTPAPSNEKAGPSGRAARPRTAGVLSVVVALLALAVVIFVLTQRAPKPSTSPREVTPSQQSNTEEQAERPERNGTQEPQFKEPLPQESPPSNKGAEPVPAK